MLPTAIHAMPNIGGQDTRIKGELFTEALKG